MLVNLSKKSWHAKYYKWVTGYYPTYKFKSLCPYFWTIVLYVVSSPVILLWELSGKILDYVFVKPLEMVDKQIRKRSFEKRLKSQSLEKKESKIRTWWNKNDEKILNIISNIWTGLILLGILSWILYGAYKIYTKEGGLYLLVFICCLVGAFTILFLIISGILAFFDSQTWDMIKGMIYSVKNKVCPMIKWEEQLGEPLNDES